MNAGCKVTYPILALSRLELRFNDGSQLWLHQAGTNPLRRTFDHEGQAHQVDLCQIVPQLHDEFYQAAENDRPAVIFFTLRHKYRTAQGFLEAVLTPRHHATPPERTH